jgi:hypothetical protein
MEITINNFKYYCDTCKHGSNSNSDYLKHIKSKKHERGGLKPKKCLICNFEYFNHWNLKQHHLTQHSTIEERKKQKYYCDICDTVFFCKLYMDRHMKGKKHNNTIECNNEINKINNNL